MSANGTVCHSMTVMTSSARVDADRLIQLSGRDWIRPARGPRECPPEKRFAVR